MRRIYRVFLVTLVGLAACEMMAFAHAEEKQSPKISAPQIREFDSSCQSHIGYFKKNKAKVDPQITNLIQYTLTEGALKECPELFLAITGQSNSSETARYGYELSKRRAMAVEELFIKAGVPKERLIVRWIGDSKVEDQTAIGQKLNQKVEIDFWRSKDLP